MSITELIEALEAIAAVHPHATVAFHAEDGFTSFEAEITGMDYDNISKKVFLE